VAGISRASLAQGADRLGLIQTWRQDSGKSAAAQALETAGISVGLCGASGVGLQRITQCHGNRFHGVVRWIDCLIVVYEFLINRQRVFAVIQHSGFILEVAPMRVNGLWTDPTEHSESSPSGMCLKVLISKAILIFQKYN
jgi:hypothetical protein